MEQVYGVPEECLSVWNMFIMFQRRVYLYGTGIWCSRGVFIRMEYVYSVPEECLSVWNVYIVFQRRVYLYGICI